MILLVMTDGRDELLDQSLPLWAENVPHTGIVIHDDTGDRKHRQVLAGRYRSLGVDIIGGDKRRGFGGAIEAAWIHLLGLTDAYVVHIEDDFLPTREVDWISAACVIESHPYLVQLALRRQPWNDEERAAGGIVESHPEDYDDRRSIGGDEWLEHRRFFTTNPSIYRRTLCRRRWPSGSNSEGRFGLDLLEAEPAARFGFWGSRDSGEWCEHIGHERVGVGY